MRPVDTKRFARLAAVTFAFALLSGGGGAAGEFTFGSDEADGLGPREFVLSKGRRGPTRTERRVGGLVMQVLVSAPRPRLEGTFGRKWSFEIGPAAGGPLEFADVETLWASCTLQYEFEDEKGDEGTFRLTLSRLSPAALIESSGGEIVCRCEANAPKRRYFYSPADGRPRAVEIGTGKPLGLKKMDFTDWLLTWREPASEASPPLLFVLGRRRVHPLVEAKGDRFRLSFAEAPASAAVLPLVGVLPADGRVDNWKAGLPADVAKRCADWGRWLCKYPVDVSETASYDAVADVIVLDESFTFKSLGGDGRGAFAPALPAAVAAKKHGLGVTFSRDEIDTDLATPLGSCHLIPAEKYQVRIKGLGKYADEVRATGPAGAKGSHLVKEIEAEVDRILEAGELAPYFVPNNTASQFYTRWRTRNIGRAAWSNPGETLFFLSEALPLLPAAKQEALREHMRTCEEKHPAAKVAHLPAVGGARRERFRVDEKAYAGWPKADMNFHLQYGLVPVENMYYLWRWHSSTGTRPGKAEWRSYMRIVAPYAAHLDWASCGFYRWDRNALAGRSGDERRPDYEYGTGGAPDLNRLFDAGVGLVRLGRGREEEAVGWWLLPRAALGRFSSEKLRGEYYDLGLWSPPKYRDERHRRRENWRRRQGGLRARRGLPRSRVGGRDGPRLPLVGRALLVVGAARTVAGPHPGAGALPGRSLPGRERRLRREGHGPLARLVPLDVPDEARLGGQLPVSGGQLAALPRACVDPGRGSRRAGVLARRALR